MYGETFLSSVSRILSRFEGITSSADTGQSALWVNQIKNSARECSWCVRLTQVSGGNAREGNISEQGILAT